MKHPLFLPATHGPVERVAMRGLFALLLFWLTPAAPPVSFLPHPNGLAAVLPLDFFLHPGIYAVIRVAVWVALALYLVRRWTGLALVCLTLFFIATGSVMNSQGAISHSRQIVALVLLAQTAAHFFHRWRGHGTGSKGEDLLIFWSQQAIAASYLVAGISKIINSGGIWVLQTPRSAVQIVKTWDQSYYDRLEPGLRETGATLAEWILAHPGLVMAVGAGGLLLELSAPLLLLGRRYALAYGAALLAFHGAIERTMQLQFENNEYVIWIYLVNVPFWTLALFHRLQEGRNPPSGPVSAEGRGTPGH